MAGSLGAGGIGRLTNHGAEDLGWTLSGGLQACRYPDMDGMGFETVTRSYVFNRKVRDGRAFNAAGFTKVLNVDRFTELILGGGPTDDQFDAMWIHIVPF